MKMTTVTLMHTQLTEDQAMLSFSDLALDVAGTGCICRVCGEEYNKDFSPVNIPRGSLVSRPYLHALSNTGGGKGLGTRLP